MCYGSMLEDSMRRARKIHRCMECGRDIKPGQVYRRSVTVDHGDFNATKECQLCHALVEAMITLEGERGLCHTIGEVRNYFREAVKHDAHSVRKAVREARHSLFRGVSMK